MLVKPSSLPIFGLPDFHLGFDWLFSLYYLEIVFSKRCLLLVQVETLTAIKNKSITI